MRARSISVSSLQFLMGAALAYTAIFNLPFLVDTYMAGFATEHTSVRFLLALPALILALTFLIFSLFLWGAIAKPLLALVSIGSLAVLYGEMTFGVVFDNDMMRNVFETDFAEASSYLSWSSGLFMFAGCGLILWILWTLNIETRPTLREIRARALSNVVILGSAGLLTLSCYGELAATMRNNSQLKRELVPFEWIDSSIDYWTSHLIDQNHPFTVVDEDPIHIVDAHDLPHVTIVMVGETARADHFQFNDYPRDTNRYTEPYQVVYLPDTESCGTATAVSVPCMFSDLGREDFDVKEAKYRQNALDLAAAAGIPVLWLDNNSSSKGVADRVDYRRLSTTAEHALCDGDYCMDSVFLEHLDRELSKEGAEERLIVLHEIGSHGPTYFRRYPSDLEGYFPDCQRSDIQNCSESELVNTYDNTILYSDWVHAQILERLDARADTLLATVIYISDHGESLGENGLYLHGMPYMVAPDTQTHVPMWIWSNDRSTNWRECIQGNQPDTAISQDYVFHTVLGAVEVESSALDSDKDLLDHCSPYLASAALVTDPT